MNIPVEGFYTNQSNNRAHGSSKARHPSSLACIYAHIVCMFADAYSIPIPTYVCICIYKNDNMWTRWENKELTNTCSATFNI